MTEPGEIVEMRPFDLTVMYLHARRARERSVTHSFFFLTVVEARNAGALSGKADQSPQPGRAGRLSTLAFGLRAAVLCSFDLESSKSNQGGRRTWRTHSRSSHDGPYGDWGDALGVPICDAVMAHMERCEATHEAEAASEAVGVSSRMGTNETIWCEATHNVKMFVSRLRPITVNGSTITSGPINMRIAGDVAN